MNMSNAAARRIPTRIDASRMKNSRTGAQQDPYHLENGLNDRHLAVKARRPLPQA
jgi:hypothetical protein